MIGALRLIALVAINDRGLLAPLLGLLLALFGVFAYRPNDVAGTWALTALLCLPLTAWLQVAIARAEPDAQRLIRIAAGGAPRARRTGAAVTAVLAAATTLAFLLWPLITGAFDRAVTPPISSPQQRRMQPVP